MSSYARLAKLPRPDLAAVDLGPLIERVAKLETRLAVKVDGGPPVILDMDRDQIEQVFINLVRNGVDASLETGGGVSIGWERRNIGAIEIWVRDGGPGLANTANLFVPFFTTKPGGSGIGLVLCRQVIEGHGGTSDLEERHRWARVRGAGGVAGVGLPADSNRLVPPGEGMMCRSQRARESHI